MTTSGSQFNSAVAAIAGMQVKMATTWKGLVEEADSGGAHVPPGTILWNQLNSLNSMKFNKPTAIGRGDWIS
jgi:hypothetical protein